MDPSQLPPGIPISQIPAGRPPHGTVPNFSSPVTLRTPVIVVNALLLTVATLTVCLRLYTRKFIVQVVGAEDYLCVLSLLGSGAHSGLLFYLVNHGLGKHVWDIQAIKLTPDLAHVFNALGLTYVMVIFLVKTSVLLLFYRLFKVSNTMRPLILLGIAFAALCCVAFTIYEIIAEVSCVTVADLRREICVGTETFTIVTGCVNTAVDIYILVLPIAMVLRLQLTKRRKWGISAVFAIGFIAVLASLVRLIINVQRRHSADVFRNGAATGILSCIEMNVGIVCASVPALPGFFHQHKLVGLGGLSSLVQRIYGRFHASTLPRSSSAGKKDKSSSSFRGIELNITGPNLGMRSGVNASAKGQGGGGKKEDGYVEIEEKTEGGLETRRGMWEAGAGR